MVGEIVEKEVSGYLTPFFCRPDYGQQIVISLLIEMTYEKFPAYQRNFKEYFECLALS